MKASMEDAKLTPVCPEDHSEWIDRFFVTACVVVDRLLTPSLEELQLSLIKLLQRDGWSKFAARLVGNAEKQELCHAITSKTFSDPVNFTSASFSTPISAHPLASLLPSTPSQLSLHDPPETYKSLFQSPNCCVSLKDLQSRGDYSPTSVHLTLFSDATLVGLTVPHSIADMTSMALLLKAWLSPDSLDLDALPPICALGDTPLNGVGDEDEEGPCCGARGAKGWELFWNKCKYGYEMLRAGMEEESRMVYFPGELVRTLRSQAEEELKSEEGAWVSDHDLAVALALKLFNPHLTAISTQTFALNRVIDTRYWAPSLFHKRTFLGVASTFTIARFPASNFSILSTPKLAHVIRSDLTASCSNEKSVHAVVRMFRTYRRRKDGTGNLSYGPPSVSCTSWVKSGLQDVVKGVRWSGAFLDDPSKGPRRYTISVVCKDASGGYWVSTDKSPGQSKGIEKKLEEMKREPSVGRVH